MGERTLAQRLQATRSRSFVGRAEELGLFAAALTASPAAFSLLWLHGPGGIGKSTLLRRFADEADARGVRPLLIDARHIDVTPAGFDRAVGTIPGGARLVLLIDTAEALRPLDTWLREEYLPRLPASSLVVLAGRDAPDDRWRADLGWSEHLHALALRNLEPEAAASYLERRGVSVNEIPDVLALTHGHPLAVALLADFVTQRLSPPASPAGLPRALDADIVTTLLQRFVGDVPDPVHRAALEVLGHARVTTEELLLAAVGPERAAECFGWLRSLTFVQTDAFGLIPHDLARTVLDDELRWRDRRAWTALRRRLREYYLDRAATGTPRERSRAIADLLWFNRHSPVLQPYLSWDTAFSLWWQPAADGDLDQILELVAAHEGPESVQLHRLWWRLQPEAFCVIRDRPDRVHGFFVQLRLTELTDEMAADPFASRALDHVRRTAPLRRGEHLRVIRSWIGRDGYHRPTPTHQALTGATTANWLTEPGLAVSVAYMSNEPLWTPMFELVGYAAAPSAQVTLEGRDYAAYLHDWRVTPVSDWLDLLGGGTAGSDQDAAAAGPPAALVVLSKPEFETAVRDALRAASRPALLAASPLLHSRVMREQLGSARASAADLRAVLTEAVSRLAADPRRQSSARALEVTYLKPASTQEAAAARLSLPFSTYRRHLGLGICAVTEDLWERELQGSAEPASGARPA
jgi:AAA ATPase domain